MGGFGNGQKLANAQILTIYESYKAMLGSLTIKNSGLPLKYNPVALNNDPTIPATTIFPPKGGLPTHIDIHRRFYDLSPTARNRVVAHELGHFAVQLRGEPAGYFNGKNWFKGQQKLPQPTTPQLLTSPDAYAWFLFE